MKKWQEEGYSLKIYKEKDYGDMIDWGVLAYDSRGNEVGHYFFNEWTDDSQGTGIDVSLSKTYDDHQRKGLATAAYLLVEKTTGKKINVHKHRVHQTDAARGFWSQKNRPFGN